MVSDHDPVWVREDVIFQVPEKRNFDAQNQFQMILLNVWTKDFTKKITRSPVSGDQVVRCCFDPLFPFQLTSVFSFSVSISFFLLFHSFVIAVLPSQWFSPCVHPCTPMLHLFGWHLKQVTVIPHNNIMPFFEYILSIFQVLLPDQPERSETNIKSKQPIYLPTILISGHKNAPVRRTWKMDKS